MSGASLFDRHLPHFSSALYKGKGNHRFRNTYAYVGHEFFPPAFVGSGYTTVDA